MVLTSSNSVAVVTSIAVPVSICGCRRYLVVIPVADLHSPLQAPGYPGYPYKQDAPRYPGRCSNDKHCTINNQHIHVYYTTTVAVVEAARSSARYTKMSNWHTNHMQPDHREHSSSFLYV